MVPKCYYPIKATGADSRAGTRKVQEEPEILGCASSKKGKFRNVNESKEYEKFCENI